MGSNAVIRPAPERPAYLIGYTVQRTNLPGGQHVNQATSRAFLVKADGTGNYSTLVMPFVKGKTSGTASFQVTASSCKIGLNFPWGQGSQKYQ